MHVDNGIRNLKCFGPKKICIPRLSTIFLPYRVGSMPRSKLQSTPGFRSVTKF